MTTFNELEITIKFHMTPFSKINNLKNDKLHNSENNLILE